MFYFYCLLSIRILIDCCIKYVSICKCIDLQNIIAISIDLLIFSSSKTQLSTLPCLLHLNFGAKDFDTIDGAKDFDTIDIRLQ
jgi:hypothetical protein